MMNKLFSILIFSILSLSVHTAFCQTPTTPQKKKTNILTPRDTSTIKSIDFYLELKAVVRQLKGDDPDKTSEIKLLDSTLITVFAGDIRYTEILTNKKGKCTFKLPLDKNFKVEISKQGYVTKHIMVNTKVPYDKRDVFSFSFDADLFEEVKGLDVSALQKPIAKVAYNFTLDGFAYDVPYTSRINADLKKLYKNYYRLQKIDADTSLFKRDTISTMQKK